MRIEEILGLRRDKLDDEPAGDAEVRARRGHRSGRRWKASPAAASETVELPFGNGERPLVAYPGKRPLIVLTSRPPQLETPFSVFDEGIFTPNDAFFVRYHLADIPLKIDSGCVSPDHSGQGRHALCRCRSRS